MLELELRNFFIKTLFTLNTVISHKLYQQTGKESIMSVRRIINTQFDFSSVIKSRGCEKVIKSCVLASERDGKSHKMMMNGNERKVFQSHFQLRVCNSLVW